MVSEFAFVHLPQMDGSNNGRFNSWCSIRASLIPSRGANAICVDYLIELIYSDYFEKIFNARLLSPFSCLDASY